MSQSAVEQIKARLTILEVIGSYVELHKAGKSYKGKSPFTNEKTPSFFVSPDRGMYYCFSSQKGGDMFTFIQEMEGVDFKGALKILAERANVELVPEDPRKRDAREAQYALLEAATEYFFRALQSNPTVSEYVTARGVTTTSIHTWRIGYAKDEWRDIRQHLKEKGFSDEQMLKAGLIKFAEQGKEPYDVFRDRVMFPIADASGRVIAFSGRTLKKDPAVPKYVNSPETELFQKSETLYGYDKAKQGIRHYDFSLIVEGQFDLVLAHQAGYSNTVAVSGTALTPHHLALLERISTRVVLALDADRAGIAAMRRSAEPMLARGMDVKVARLPAGADPADVVRENPNNFKQIVGQAIPVIEFLLTILKEQNLDERVYKLRVREEILPLVASIPNRIDRDHFVGLIATTIGSSKEAVEFEVGRIIELHGSKSPRPTTNIEAPTTAATQTSRRHALSTHLLAVLETLGTERVWIKDQLNAELTILATIDPTILEKPDTETMSAALFNAETFIEKLSDRMLAEELSHQVSTLTKIIAKENLTKLRDAIQNAEQRGDSAEAMRLLTLVKASEELLQHTPVIKKAL